MVDLEAMRFMAGRLRRDGFVAEDDEVCAGLLEAAAAELAERRREPVAQGPSVEERLVAYRCAGIAGAAARMSVNIIDQELVEDFAHAMLAAERAVTS